MRPAAERSIEPSMEDPFAPFRRADPARPFVVAQLGQSLDGRIATITGMSKYINGAPALDHLHRIRAEVDAVVVGAGTVVADDPQLTVRRVPGRSPARVVIDPTGRLKSPAKWHEHNGVSCFVITACSVESLPPGLQHIRLEADNGAIAPRAIVDALFARGMKKILIEGGARTISSFIDAGCIDRLHLLFAPIIIGSGRNGLDLAPISDLSGALRPKTVLYPLGEREFLIDCDLRQTEGGG
jgi:diaminohydroxyphosphoribosylaminopyrimidine deaminase/5-amino-6-(5-phosphoribosylamino)uracil reductase